MNFNKIFLDFDGTITKKDVVGTFFMNFAGPKWLDIEKDWVEGKISSKTCMLLQLDTIKNLTEEKFYNFLNSVELQDGFVEFCYTARKLNKQIIIISDGFDFFISRILKNHGLLKDNTAENLSPKENSFKTNSKETEQNCDIKIYANKLEVLKENNFLKFNLSFPNEDKNCTASLGSCKCAKAKTHITKDEFFIFAGDGLSDRCIARKANLLFAKNSLKKHCLENNIKFVEFEDFFQISDYLFKEGTTEDARVEAKGKAHRG